MFTGLLLQPLALALVGLTQAAPSKSHQSDCEALATSVPKLFPDVSVYVAKEYPDNTTFTEPTAIVGYNTPVPNLPAFCRLGAYIKTSDTSKTQFELWLPTASWNGRFSMVGNGGDAGGVNYPDMFGPIKNYGFAVASTDAGHNGTSGDGTFAINAPQKQIDFGYRAVHLTATYSQRIVKEFYRKKPAYSYWFGCSSGGKQGLKEMQIHPETFDGVVAGAAAQYWQTLNSYTYHVNAHINTLNSTGFLNATDYSLIGNATFAQCDSLDGLKDGIITNPRICKPNLSKLLCPNGVKAAGCLIQAQIDNMQKQWSNYTSSQDGKFIFSGFSVGAEASPAYSVNGVPGPGPDFYNYQVLNNTKVQPFNVTEPELEKLLAIAEVTNPGQTNAGDPNIGKFLKKGKLLTYVGGQDTLIPDGSSHVYYESVRTALGYPKNLGDSYRFFEVPGMWHCRGGQSAFNFGGPGQRSQSVGGGSTSATFDKQHDMILAMMDWVEKGNAPDKIIGSKYVNDDKRQGVAFQRPLCPYPQQAKYKGGDPNSASSFECRYTPW